jgi:hypothetical protein
MENTHKDLPMLVVADSIEIGDFRVEGGYLTTELKLAVCNRAECLLLFVEPFGDEIGVAVYDAVLDYSALAVVAEGVAAKLNTATGTAVLAMVAGGSRQLRRGLPQVRVKLNRLGGTSNG